MFHQVLNLVSTNRADLDRQKFDREEAYVLEQELSGHLSTMREELDKHKATDCTPIKAICFSRNH